MHDGKGRGGQEQAVALPFRKLWSLHCSPRQKRPQRASNSRREWEGRSLSAALLVLGSDFGAA